ncbi:hypothetical protein GCM10009765_34580 [Fodinicola feengrottensis]|uniref:Peptidase inhibitor family I36 n=1 Tax=Fodinicola feengrottensis TaxID=435914 RepID=A0ABN2H5U2_9ACTN
MSSLRRLLVVLVALAGVIAGAQAPVSASVKPAMPASVDTQLQMLRQSDTTVKFRRATAADHQIPGARVALRPAGSATPADNCSGLYLCLYADANAGGLEIIIPQGVSIPYLGNACVGGICYQFNDRMTSWENVSSWTYCWYYDANYTGQQRFMEYYGFNVRNVAPNDNDQASSVLALAPSEQRVTC